MIPIPKIESNERGIKIDDQTPITEREQCEGKIVIGEAKANEKKHTWLHII